MKRMLWLVPLLIIAVLYQIPEPSVSNGSAKNLELLTVSGLRLNMDSDEVLKKTGEPDSRVVYSESLAEWVWVGECGAPGIKDLGFENGRLTYINFSASSQFGLGAHLADSESLEGQLGKPVVQNFDSITRKTHDHTNSSLVLDFERSGKAPKNQGFLGGTYSQIPIAREFEDYLRVSY